MDILNRTNFINYFVLHPYSNKLSAKDRLKAVAASIALGIFTLGIVHIVAAVRLHKWKKLDPNGFVSFQDLLTRQYLYSKLLEGSLAERARFFGDPDKADILKDIIDSAKPVYEQLLKSFIEEKKKLPAETFALDLKQKFIQWIAEEDERWGDIVMLDEEYYPLRVFAADAHRAAPGEWIINGVVVPGESGTMLELIVKGLYVAFDKNLRLLDNFAKIAHQGFMNIASKGLVDKFGYPSFVWLEDTERHYNVETTSSEIRLKFYMEHEVWGGCNYSDYRKKFGTAQVTLEMIIPKADLAKGDLSKMQVSRTTSALES